MELIHIPCFAAGPGVAHVAAVEAYLAEGVGGAFITFLVMEAAIVLLLDTKYSSHIAKTDNMKERNKLKCQNV